MRHTPILKADALSLRHGPPPAPLLFDRLAIRLLPGVTWVTGDESSGKSTLLRLLAGVLPVTETETAPPTDLQVNGIHLADNRLLYLQQVAWLDPRDTALDPQTARQIFNTVSGRHPDFNAGALQVHIEGLSLTPHLDKSLFMLSSGTRRKVLMAASLASGAAVTLLDQPFMALDRPSIDYLLQVLQLASRQTNRAWVVADYEAPEDVTLAGVITLGN